MKRLMIVFFALCAFVVALSAAEIPLTAKDFVLGNRTAGSVKYQVSFDDGVLTVMISPSPKIGNATLGAVLNIPVQKMRGMGVRFRGEVRYENIASDAGGPYWGRKDSCEQFPAGRLQLFCFACHAWNAN